MLDEGWEKYANELSKAKNGKEIIKVCQKISEKENITNIPRGEEVCQKQMKLNII